MDQLKSCEAYLDTVSSSTSATLDTLSTLSQSFKNVNTQTTVFQKQCQDLVEEQKRLENIADDVEGNLRYYSYLEPITRRLNAPGAGNFVRGQEFSDMLARLDECLEYMSSHVCLKRRHHCYLYVNHFYRCLSERLLLIGHATVCF